MPAKVNNLPCGCNIQGKEQRPPEPGVNLSSFYDTSDLLKTASRVEAVRTALPQASSSFALAHCSRVGWRIAAPVPPKNRACDFNRTRLKPLQRHLAAPGFTSEISWILSFCSDFLMNSVFFSRHVPQSTSPIFCHKGWHPP